eukprot:3102610-Rhodomonas_salina.1
MAWHRPLAVGPRVLIVLSVLMLSSASKTPRTPKVSQGSIPRYPAPCDPAPPCPLFTQRAMQTKDDARRVEDRVEGSCASGQLPYLSVGRSSPSHAMSGAETADGHPRLLTFLLPSLTKQW